MMKQKSKPNISKQNTLVRLNKFIADSGICSRRKADILISEGRVKVNKKTVTELGFKVAVSDFITIDGNPISQDQRLVYILLNKPKNTISTTDDDKNRATILDIVKSKHRIFSIGRLDRNTTGVILLTNDGMLANRLMHPRYQIERVYNVGLDRALTEKVAEQIAKGISTPEFQSSPCELIIDRLDNTKATVILKEGKNHEIKKMFETFDYFVKKLDRKIFAGLTAKGLNRGEYRHLTKSEVNNLKRLTKLN